MSVVLLRESIASCKVNGGAQLNRFDRLDQYEVTYVHR